MWNDRNFPSGFRPQVSGRTAAPPVAGGFVFDSATEEAYADVVDEAVLIYASDESALTTYTFPSEATTRAALT